MKTLTIVALPEKKKTPWLRNMFSLYSRGIKADQLIVDDAVFVKHFIKWWIACFTLVDEQRRMTPSTQKKSG